MFFVFCSLSISSKKRIFYPFRTPKIPWQRREKTLEKNKEVLAGEKARNSKKARRGRTGQASKYALDFPSFEATNGEIPSQGRPHQWSGKRLMQPLLHLMEHSISTNWSWLWKRRSVRDGRVADPVSTPYPKGPKIEKIQSRLKFSFNLSEKNKRATTKGRNRLGFPHFSEFFRTFPPGLFLRIKGFYYYFSSKRRKET